MNSLFNVFLFASVIVSVRSIQDQSKDAPKIPPLSFPPNVQTGLSTKVFCTVDRGAKPLEFKWKYNDKEIQNTDSSIVINTYEDFSVLNIDPVSSKYSGNYTCIVTNIYGKDSYTTGLLVQEPASWLKEPEDKELLEGEHVSIHCMASGLPKPNIVWYKYNDPEDPPKENKSKILTTSNGTLSIPKADINDNGKYECVAENGLGSPLKKLITIKVSGKTKYLDENARKITDLRILAQQKVPLLNKITLKTCVQCISLFLQRHFALAALHIDASESFRLNLVSITP